MGSININVMMFGGRRAGKTSVLAAMQTCFEEDFGKGNLTISTADDETMLTIENKKNEMASYFHNRGKRDFTPDETPTLDKMEYRFRIGLKNKSSDSIIVNFIDYPGEWLSNKDKIATLGDMMNQSDIIIVAIDSPHLMEEAGSDDEDAIGVYNDYKNYSSRIGEMLKRYCKERQKPMMIIFVPLKCEKYYHENKMDVLNIKLKKAYESTFNYVEGENRNRFEVIIAPILTFGDVDGGVEFHSFARDENYDIIINQLSKTPEKSIYFFTKEMSAPRPRHCEQPMVYILAYVLEMAKKVKEYEKNKESVPRTIVRWFKEKFFDEATLDDFGLEMDKVRRFMEKNANGYEIVSNPLRF